MHIDRSLFSLTMLVYIWSLCGKSDQTSQCEIIRVPMCVSQQWNLTQMPNLMDQSSQQNARLKIEEYQPLVRDNCSEYLQFFLCAIFTPICTTSFYDNPIPPCREVCRQVRQGCESVIINKYNKTWPDRINCDNFPEYNTGVCISPEAIQLESPEANAESEIAVESGKGACNCRKKTRLHMRRYIQSDFGYVIRATVKGTGLIADDLIISLNIKRILKNRSNLRLRANATLILWTAGDSCQSACPSVRKKKDYIIACSKIVDSVNGRLLFDTNTCMISRWKNKWPSTIQTWERIVRLPEISRNQELKKLRHNKKYLRSEIDGTSQPAG